MRIQRRRGFSLIEMLVVVVVIAVLAAILLPRYTKGGKTTTGETVETPIQRAHSVECQNNLRQIRQAYQMATTLEETRPTTIEELRSQGVSDSISRCPVGQEPYRLDAASGRVQCVHAGHESY